MILDISIAITFSLMLALLGASFFTGELRNVLSPESFRKTFYTLAATTMAFIFISGIVAYSSAGKQANQNGLSQVKISK